MSETRVKRKPGYKIPPEQDPAIWETPSHTELLLLYHLNDIADANESRTVDAYHKDLAAHMGISRRRVQTCLSNLAKRKYILISPTQDDRGRPTANRYTILNPDRRRHLKTVQAADVSGIPLDQMVEYIYWLYFHRKKLKDKLYPTVGDIAQLAHCPAPKAGDFVRGLAAAGILTGDKEINF